MIGILTKEIDLNVKVNRVRQTAQIAVCTGVFAAAMVVGLAGLRPFHCLAQEAKPAEGDQVPLPVKLPKAVFAGTAANTKVGPNVEKMTGKPRPIPMVPKGTVNLAFKKKVTSSAAPFSGSLDLITDGDKEARDDSAVELKP